MNVLNCLEVFFKDLFVYDCVELLWNDCVSEIVLFEIVGGKFLSWVWGKRFGLCKDVECYC